MADRGTGAIFPTLGHIYATPDLNSEENVWFVHLDSEVVGVGVQDGDPVKHNLAIKHAAAFLLATCTESRG